METEEMKLKFTKDWEDAQLDDEKGDYWRISKEFHFAYAHQLHGLEEGHPCGRVHGHNGILVVELEGNKLDDSGFVMDYRKMDPLKKFLDEKIDHFNLNDVFDFQPSSENLAKWFFFLCKYTFGWPVRKVSWSETPKTWCHYFG